MRGALSLRGVSCLPAHVLLLLSVLKASVLFSKPASGLTARRAPMGGPVRGRGSAGRLATRRGGRSRGVFPGRGAARGGLVRGWFRGPRLVLRPVRSTVSVSPQQAAVGCVAVAALQAEGGAAGGAAADRP